MDSRSALATHAVCLLLPLVLVGKIALASEQWPERGTLPSPPAQKSAEETQAIKDRVAEWLKTCLADWDHATHMTKAEWQATCRRVAMERGRFLIENPTMDTPFKGVPQTQRR